MNDDLKQFDPPSQNNSRSIVRGMIEKAGDWRRKYNLSFNHLVEVMSGIPSDRTAADVGIEPEPLAENNQ